MDRGGVRQALATNLKAPFFLIRTCCRSSSQQSSVILVGSVSAYIGHENATVYGAAKAACSRTRAGLTYELKDRGIRVNGPSPVPIRTTAFRAPRRPAPGRPLRGNSAMTVPLHRLGTAHRTGQGSGLPRLGRIRSTPPGHRVACGSTRHRATRLLTDHFGARRPVVRRGNRFREVPQTWKPLLLAYVQFRRVSPLPQRLQMAREMPASSGACASGDSVS